MDPRDVLNRLQVSMWYLELNIDISFQVNMFGKPR